MRPRLYRPQRLRQQAANAATAQVAEGTRQAALATQQVVVATQTAAAAITGTAEQLSLVKTATVESQQCAPAFRR